MPEAIKGDTRDQIGALVGVGGRSIDAANKVLKKETPELTQAVDRRGDAC